MIAGRGSAKTTDVQVERLIEMVYEMPGAPVVWVSDTYTNLQQNVLPTVMEGLALKGYIDGVHYVKEKAPPVYTEAEKQDLPPHIREHFWKPYNKLASYKHTFLFFTGLNITFASLDRPASLAGRNYVHVFGDEAKYFREDRVSNLLKAVRGYRIKYGHSVFYRGHTFTTDMPDPSRLGEHDWILKQGRKMRSWAMVMVLKLAFVVNEAVQEYLVACEELQEKKSQALRETVIKKHRNWQRWLERWTAARLHPDAQTLFFIASSFVNADILTPGWFQEAIDSDFADLNSAILSIRQKIGLGDLFYANLQERHFYRDGNDPLWSARFGLSDKEDCRILRYLDLNQPLDGGADFGNMNSLIIAQQGPKYYRCLKFIHVLSPDWIREWSDKFIEYFRPHKNKVLNLSYDRAANNYKETGQDLATQLKTAIEKDAGGKSTGWKVILISEGQGNIPQNEEYNFMQELFSENNAKLPKVLIDFYNCKPLRCSLEMALPRKNSKGQVMKDKRSEQLPIKRLPLESTNPSDSFKYLMMRRHLRRLVRGAKKPYTGTTGTV